MIIENRVSMIQSRLRQAFLPTFLEVVDESHQHIGHTAYQGGQRHFAIIISADIFKNCSRIEAHRKIYALFTDMIPRQIHALRIIIKE